MWKPFRLHDFDQEKGRITSTTTFLILVAVLITGGGNPNLNTELFVPSAGTSCTLPPLQPQRWYHSVDNNILCGSLETAAWRSCLKWIPDTGSWKELLTLDVQRYGHVSWTPDTDKGTYLMGGDYTAWTTVLIKDDGTQEPAFRLQYSTSLVLWK